MKTYDPHKSTNDVRQGNRRKANMRVLVISTALIVLAFIVLYVIYTMTQPGTTGVA
ncbi:hypothetical protein PSQ90_12175 [Devosia rhodophyticola]|uniref:Uncharacterized protein n=1 Tax=Devosia rhodophyticola TaxID=3026423 RepID=A0ABY7YUL3_9HYPH|nr:hypothetical protein [Devosia rhodophyticola]WDR05045.1 hypothetical protein PSQ90_12175 [Devosia rhodophyticola]